MPSGVTAPGFVSTPSTQCSGTNISLTSTDIELVPIWLPTGVTFGHFGFCTGATAAVSPTHWWVALFNSSYQMLAVSADKTSTALGTYTLIDLAIATIASGSSSTFTTTYTGLYFLGFCIVASTVPSLVGNTAPSNTSINGAIGVGWGPVSSGQSGPPSFPFTAGTPGTNNTILPYAFIAQ